MRYKGIVSWFDIDKGFGFIKNDELGMVFVHHAAIVNKGFRYLNENDVVEFSVVDGNRGLMASDVFSIDN